MKINLFFLKCLKFVYTAPRLRLSISPDSLSLDSSSPGDVFLWKCAGAVCGLDLWDWQDKGRTWSGVNLLPFRTNRYIFSVVCSLQGTHITSFIREYTNLRYATFTKMKIKAKLIVRNDTFIHLWFYYSTYFVCKIFIWKWLQVKHAVSQ